MNPLFDEALSFVSDTVRRFYAGTGIEQVVERFSDDLSWIGAGEVEFSTSAEEIVSYLTKRAPLAPPCEVFDEEFYLVNVTECSCTVMGRYLSLIHISFQIIGGALIVIGGVAQIFFSTAAASKQGEKIEKEEEIRENLEARLDQEQEREALS